MNRREFLAQTGLAAGLTTGAALAAPRVSIVVDAEDRLAAAAPVRWAVKRIEEAFAGRNVPVRIYDRLSQAPAADACVVVAGKAELAKLPAAPEAMALVPAKISGRAVLLASGTDVRGTVYAALEVADRVRYAADPAAALNPQKPLAEKPANEIRSIARCFESDVEDKGWFHDRAMWREYLSMLAAQRYNRFSLTLGLGYNFPRNVTDVYFYFAYPFLVRVPGYDVRVVPLPGKERDANLETLRFIAEETAARGLHFQLALWTHAYQWVDSPRANYAIEGLTPENHAAYCRDALAAVLKECPGIAGVTFRVHGESGIPEGSYDFWRTVFDGVVRGGRRIEIDMHAKGIDQKTIDIALATGMPVNVSPKYWAEHMGLPYHQASIRELEMPPRDRKVEGAFALSSGSRRFLRYGYGDLLTEDRRHGILYRIWPGTQRHLLWGDPEMAAGYGRYSSFCGSNGVEWCEPLSFKGRMGSGLPGGRLAYADASLATKYDWQKYLYQYRVWGRLLYNPEADPDGWRRQLRSEFGAGAQPAEAALGSASRALLLVTTAHGLSGSNNRYWPEMYTDMPIVDAGRDHPYTDTPAPRRFGTVGSFDPQLFSTVEEFAAGLLEGRPVAKYSPIDVAVWLEDMAATAEGNLKRLQAKSPEARRLAADVAIQAGLAKFFAGKMRAAVLWALFDRTGEREALDRALKQYRAARAAWAEAAEAGRVYKSDVTYGATPYLRGHWLDRLPAIDGDIADMERRLAPARTAPNERARHAILQALGRSPGLPPAFRHRPARQFKPGEPLEIEASFDKAAGRSVRLHYRRVNQAEAWQSLPMTSRDEGYRAAIPGSYTQSPYPLQYYFEVRDREVARICPGFNAELSNQPYFVVRSA